MATRQHLNELVEHGETLTEEEKQKVEVEEELLFYVAGIVVLTLLLNGTLIGTFYNWLNPYPELRQKAKDRGPGLVAVMQGFEADIAAKWAAKAQ
jgi:hypothetical protein